MTRTLVVVLLALLVASTAACKSFNGQKLYRRAFDAIRNHHLDLADPAERKEWAAIWGSKHRSDGALDCKISFFRPANRHLNPAGESSRFDEIPNT